MSMADRARMDGLEERIAALELAKFKERLDVLEEGVGVVKDARASGWPLSPQAGKALENEVRVLRARMEKLEKTL